MGADVEVVPGGPLVGVKYAMVARDEEGALRFRSTGCRPGHARCYDVEARAVCQTGREHRPPAWHCMCGFYATPDLDTLRKVWAQEQLDRSTVLLQVQLWGRVVEHRYGWRAANQTVLAAIWDERCRSCGGQARGFVLPRRSGSPVTQSCTQCHADVASPSMVAGELGTEVRFGSGIVPANLWSQPHGRARRWGRALLRLP